MATKPPAGQPSDRDPQEWAGRLDRRQLLMRGAGGVGAFSLAGFLAACGGSLDKSSGGGGSGAAKTGGKIGFTFLYSEVSFAATMKNFAKERGKELGFEVLTDNVRGGNVDDQRTSLDSFITRKVDAIVCHVLNPPVYGSIIKRAEAAGIPFFTYAQAVPNTYGGVLFPFDEAANNLSRDATDWVTANLGGKAKILVLGYTVDPAGARATDLFSKTITDETDSKVVAAQDALDQATGLRVTEDALKANPDINVVLAWNDGGALGAAQAMKKAKKDPDKIYIASSEGTEQGINGMLNGNEYLKTINLLSIKALGYGIVDLPVNYLKTKKKGDLEVGRTIVHSDEKDVLEKAAAEYS
jgi:ABC-type sugar transport system substrate-binding protein